jgi:hypothetical protein
LSEENQPKDLEGVENDKPVEELKGVISSNVLGRDTSFPCPLPNCFHNSDGEISIVPGIHRQTLDRAKRDYYEKIKGIDATYNKVRAIRKEMFSNYKQMQELLKEAE